MCKLSAWQDNKVDAVSTRKSLSIQNKIPKGRIKTLERDEYSKFQQIILIRKNQHGKYLLNKYQSAIFDFICEVSGQK